MRPFVPLKLIVFAASLPAMMALASCGPSAEEYVAACDAKASHPQDAERRSAGVTDEQFAPGAAIEICEHAAKASPETARVWFELGRSYWLANRDSEAFAAFVQAVKRDNAPAMKFIGDAYLEGRGLPSGETQNVDVALKWYKKSNDGGFREGGRAFQEATEYIAKSTFDISIFQNKGYMRRVYEKKFDNIDNPMLFFAYLRAFVDELGGDKVLFVDSQCKPLITAIGSAVLGVGQVLSIIDAFKDKESIGRGLGSLLFVSIAQDQGERDAIALVNRYGCKSSVARNVISGIMLSYKEGAK